MPNKRGVALVTVLVVSIILIILVAGVLMLATSRHGMSQHQLMRTKAYYAAMAGVAYAYHYLQTNTLGDSEVRTIYTNVPWYFNTSGATPVVNTNRAALPINATFPSKSPGYMTVQIGIGAINDTPLVAMGKLGISGPPNSPPGSQVNSRPVIVRVLDYNPQ